MIKFLLPILLLFYTIAKSQDAIHINGSGQRISINTGGISVLINSWRFNSIIDDDGYYNGFLMVLNGVLERTEGIFKKAGSHAGAGPMTFVKTVNSGTTWTTNQVTFDGSPVTTLNYSIGRFTNTRTTIAWRGTDSLIKVGYNDIATHAFTLTQTLDLDTDSFLVYPSSMKMVSMPSGNLLFVLYKLNLFGGRTTAVIYESSNGETFTLKSQIYSHNSAVSNPTLGDWRGNEVGIGITHNTGTDATCKMIAIIRTQVPNEGGTYAMHFFSSDGGTTWAKSLIGDAGSFVDDNGTTIVNNSPGLSRHLLYSFIGTNAPQDVLNNPHKGRIYIINGERNHIGSNKYARKYITATPDGAYRNKWDDWIRPIQVRDYYNAATLGASIDCGYANGCILGGHVYAADYDVSTQAADLLKSATRCFVEIQKIE